MAKWVDIETVADYISDKIIKRMRYVEENMINSLTVRDELEEMDKKIAKKIEAAEEKKSSSIKKIMEKNPDISNEELERRVAQTQNNIEKEIADMIAKKEAYIERVKQTKFSKLQQIRFVYLELAKYLEKNTAFFLNDKLDELALSDDEIKAIYSNNLLLISDKGRREAVYQIICKSAAVFLKTAYDKLGIESSYIHTVSSTDDDIKHWFLVAQDDDCKQYFLTLAADLPFIKNNFRTEHFATKIPLFDEQGNPLYDALDIDNENIRFRNIKHTDRVTGEVISCREVEHVVLDDEQLKSLDFSIDYSRLYETEKLAKSSGYNSLYAELLSDNSHVLKIYRKCFGFNEGEISSDLSQFDDDGFYKKFIRLRKSDYDRFKYLINEYVFSYISEKDSSFLDEKSDFDSFKKDCIVNLLKKLGVENVDLSLSSVELLKKYKSFLKPFDELNNIDIKNRGDKIKKFDKLKRLDPTDVENYLDIYAVIKNLVHVENSFETYFVLMDNIDLLKRKRAVAVSEKESAEIIEKIDDAIDSLYKSLKKVKGDLSISKVKKNLHNIAFITSVRDKITFNPCEFVPQTSIVERFQLMFPRVMDCNYEDYETDSENNFSNQGYSEQIVIVKKMLALIFSDLCAGNCAKVQGYNDRYNAVENRINTYPVVDRTTGEYCIAFCFTATPEEGNVEFIYIPSKNLLRSRDPVADNSDYLIVSTRYKTRTSHLENIEKRKGSSLKDVFEEVDDEKDKDSSSERKK